MTGKYCNSVGVWHTIMGRSLLDPAATTLADCFKSSGYRTGIYGKWHLGDNYPCRPHDRGFDDAVVCGGGGIWQGPDYFGNDDRDDSYLHNGRFEKYQGFSTDVFFDLSMKFMGEAQAAGKPFFCYIPTPAAHVPNWALEKDTAPYEHVPGLEDPGFYGMISNIDTNMGRLVRFLEKTGMRENTILIFATDNGTAGGEKVFNASMRGIKNSAYDGGHRVPFFVEWPAGGLKGGRDIKTLAKDIDVLPTLAELCQLKDRGTDLDGRSLRPLLDAGSVSREAAWPDRTIIVDSQREELMVKWRKTTVMTQRWRLVNPSQQYDANNPELYDIAKDPGQERNVAQQHPDVVKALREKYDLWWDRIRPANDKFVRIVLGNERENPSTLNSMDWHDPGALDVWNQRQILTGPVANGSWAVDICCAGKYRFELRRWPREVDMPINAAYSNLPGNKETTPGVSIEANHSHIEIAGMSEDKPVEDGAKFVEFVLTLREGPTELRTRFTCNDQKQRGAYYVYVTRERA